MLNGLRFASDVPSPRYAHPAILPHLIELIPYVERVGGKKSDNFVMTWSENPRGAVTTFGEVLTEAMNLVGDDTIPVKDAKGNVNPDAGKKIANELARFLRFVRREFSDSFDDNVRMCDEFKHTVQRPWESALNARLLGLPATSGAWRSFFNFIERYARRPFVQAVASIAQKSHPMV